MGSYLYDVRRKAWVRDCGKCDDIVVGTDDEKESIKIFRESFYYGSNEDGFASYCRRCQGEVNRIGKGINATDEEVKELLLLQKGKCAICEKSIDTSMGPRGSTKSATIDHCHRSGKIRGLLCHACNRALGGFQDDINILERALSYLKANLPFPKEN